MKPSLFAQLRRLFLAVTLVLSATACQSVYDTQPDFEESRQRILSGDQEAAKEEVQIIVRDINQIPKKFHDEAVKNVAMNKSETGQQGLITLMEHPSLRDDELRAEIANTLVERDEEGSLEALLIAAENRPNIVTPEVIAYFGEKQYLRAIPLLQKQVEAGKHINEAVAALYQMEDPGANEYILSLSMNQPDELRELSLETVAQMPPEDGVHSKAVPIYEGIVRKYRDEPRSLVVLSIQGLAEYGSEDTSFEALRTLYETTDDATLQQSALAAMARLRNTTAEQLERELNTALLDIEAQIEYLRTKDVEEEKEPEKEVVEKVEKEERPKPVRKKRARYDSKYRQRLDRKFDSVFGPDLSSQLQAHLNNVLLSYADWKDDAKGRFILRSYRKYYGGDDDGARKRLREGLDHPGSFSVIVKNIIAEYDNDAMRIYAMSQFFNIKRWQAAILLDMVRYNQI